MDHEVPQVLERALSVAERVAETQAGRNMTVDGQALLGGSLQHGCVRLGREVR